MLTLVSNYSLVHHIAVLFSFCFLLFSFSEPFCISLVVTKSLFIALNFFSFLICIGSSENATATKG